MEMRLAVPYSKQVSPLTCGAAALEMVYRFFGVDEFDQAEFFETHKTPYRHYPGEWWLDVASLDADATSRGFDVWSFSAPDRVDAVGAMMDSLRRGAPVIACQQLSKETTRGHFRVVVGLGNGRVVAHDPSGSPDEAWRVSDFLDLWPRGSGLSIARR